MRCPAPLLAAQKMRIIKTKQNKNISISRQLNVMTGTTIYRKDINEEDDFCLMPANLKISLSKSFAMEFYCFTLHRVS